MDEFTKRRVRHAAKLNPDLHIKFVISAIRARMERDSVTKRQKPTPAKD